MDVAFATCATLPDITPDDDLTAEVLRGRGVSVVPAVWDDPAVEWTRFGGVVIRSTWDYHLDAGRFAAWVRRCASSGVRLWNAPDGVLANMNKRYLAGLAGDGIDVVPTEYLDVRHGRRLADVLEQRGWDQAVVKPAVSASAHGTWRTSRATATADQRVFEAESSRHEVLVQRYLDEIATDGEWSLMFFAGEYSHAVIKRPATADFRVQSELGGSADAADPPPDVLDACRRVLSRWRMPSLYARVDGVALAGRFTLMELEIIEPFLFLGSSPAAAVRFAEAIAAVLR